MSKDSLSSSSISAPGKKIAPAVETKVDSKEVQKPLSFEESSLGKLVSGAKEAQKKPEELKKRVAAKKKKPVEKDKKPDEQDLKDAADKVAEAGKKIEVKKNDNGEEVVKMELDLAKMDLSGFTPDVKGFDLEINSKRPDGREESVKVVVSRGIEQGKIGYFVRGPDGKMKELKLPLEGTASLTINPGQYEKWAPEKVLKRMGEEMAEAAAQLARKETSEDLEDDLTDLASASVGGAGSGSGGGRSGGSTGIEPSPSSRGPSRSPSGIAPLPSPDKIKYRAQKMPEVINGPLNTKTKPLVVDDAPDGLINFSQSPDLVDKVPRFIFLLSGDGSSAEGSLEEASAEVDALRRAGVNAVLVVPAHGAGGTDDKWRYLDEKCDAMFETCFNMFNVESESAEAHLICKSGGYRAAASILKNTTYKKNIATITALDATFPDDDDNFGQSVVDYVRGGGKAKFFTGTREGPKKGMDFISGELDKDAGTGQWEHIPTDWSHGKVMKDCLQDALAFAGQVKLEASEKPSEMEQTELDEYLSHIMTSEASDAFAGPCKGEAKPKHCEQFAGLLSKYFRSRITGADSNFLIFDTPVVEEATARLRGKAVSDFSPEDFDRPGYTYFINRPDKYGNLIAPGTSNKLERIADKRHWFIYLGRDAEGIQRFADNWGANHTLEEMKTKYGKFGRVVLNVHDPLADYRDKMQVAAPAAPSAPATPSPSLSPSDSSEILSTSLQKDIERITEGMQGNVAVDIFDPDTGKSIARLNENELLPSASLIKVPILFALHEAVKLGKVDDRDVPQLMSDAKLMISESDNPSTDRIINYLGIEWIKTTIKELGLNDTKFGGLMSDKTTRENWITAQDMAKVMTLAMTQEPPAGWPSAMDLMQINGHSGKLGEMIPEEVKIARKCGQISNQEHYSAVFTLGKKRLVMVVMVSDFDKRNRAKEGIREIGMRVYDALRGENNT